MKRKNNKVVLLSENPFKKNKYEICYKLLNAGLVAGISFLTTWFSSGELNFRGFIASLGAGLIVFLVTMQNYWKQEEDEYCSKVKLLMLI